jgi:hypothetical protein
MMRTDAGERGRPFPCAKERHARRAVESSFQPSGERMTIATGARTALCGLLAVIVSCAVTSLTSATTWHVPDGLRPETC